MEQKLDFTFLDEEQIFYDKKLDILKQYGTKCAITDFAIFLGGSASGLHTSEGISGKNHTSTWWTKSPNRRIGVYTVGTNGNMDVQKVISNGIGARPVLSFSSISSISSNEERLKTGILEVEFGEYPQDIVSEDLSVKLEKLYLDKTINKTGKNYKTCSVKYDNMVPPIQLITHIEYEYNGKKYIRLMGDSNCIGEVLSDGRVIEYASPYWVEVKPIKWMIDEKTNMAICKKIVFSGVRFNGDRYNGDFKNTEIKKYMDNYFSKDIIPSKINSKNTNYDAFFNVAGLNYDIFKILKINPDEYLKKILDAALNIKDKEELNLYLQKLKQDTLKEYDKVKKLVKENTYSKGVNVNDRRSFSIKLTGLKEEILEEIKKLNQDKVKIEVEENKKVYRVKVKKIQK